MWSDLRAYRASEFKGDRLGAKQRRRKRDKLAAWTEAQSARFQEMLGPVEPFLRNLQPPIRRVAPDADEYIPGPGLALTVVWDRQGPFVVATDDSAAVKGRRVRQARATEAGLVRVQLVERVEAVEADLYAIMGVAPVPELALRSALDEARTIGIPTRSPHLFRTAAALLELLERASPCEEQPAYSRPEAAAEAPFSTPPTAPDQAQGGLQPRSVGRCVLAAVPYQPCIPHITYIGASAEQRRLDLIQE